MSRAIIYLRATGYAESAAACFAHLNDHGYDFRGIVQDWDKVLRMLNRRECTVAIVADPSDLDPERKPRVEFASYRPDGGGKYWDERARVIRRDALE